MTEPLPLQETAESLLARCQPLLQKAVRAAALRWRLQKEDAEDLLSEVQLKLLENDCQALRSCQDRDRLAAFLATTVTRTWLDRRNHDWGKWRPCAEAKRQGPDGELLDRLLNRDQLSFDEVLVKLEELKIPWTRAEVERRAALFPTRHRRRQESDEGLEEKASPLDSPEKILMVSERAEQRDFALRLIGEETARQPPEIQLALRAWLRGQTITAIAQNMQLERRPLYRKFENLFENLRRHLESHGIDLAEAQEILSLERWEGELASGSFPRLEVDLSQGPSPLREDDPPRAKRK